MKVKSITKLGSGRVVNLCVLKNHTIVSANGIVSHNCDAGKPQVLIDLHPVLELKGVLAKKARRMIYPAKGFCVIATGNSKGSGDATGRYTGVNTMNHAFLQRFAAAIEFKPATRYEIELILRARHQSLSNSVTVNLCNWYEHVLKSYTDGGSEEYINTRKIIDIGTICQIFNIADGTHTDMQRAIRAGLSLYEEATVEALIHLYTTIAKVIHNTKIEVGQPSARKTEPANIDESGLRIPF